MIPFNRSILSVFIFFLSPVIRDHHPMPADAWGVGEDKIVEYLQAIVQAVRRDGLQRELMVMNGRDPGLKLLQACSHFLDDSRPGPLHGWALVAGGGANNNNNNNNRLTRLAEQAAEVLPSPFREDVSATLLKLGQAVQEYLSNPFPDAQSRQWLSIYRGSAHQSIDWKIWAYEEWAKTNLKNYVPKFDAEFAKTHRYSVEKKKLKDACFLLRYTCRMHVHMANRGAVVPIDQMIIQDNADATGTSAAPFSPLIEYEWQDGCGVATDAVLSWRYGDGLNDQLPEAPVYANARRAAPIYSTVEQLGRLRNANRKSKSAEAASMLRDMQQSLGVEPAALGAQIQAVCGFLNLEDRQNLCGPYVKLANEENEDVYRMWLIGCKEFKKIREQMRM